MRTPRRVEILHRAREYDGYFKLDLVTLRYEKYDGAMSDAISRLVFERGDAVGVLLYDRQHDSVLLVEQFRPPAYLRGGEGWLLEIVAGVVEPGKNEVEIAQQELLEEAGLWVEHLIPWGGFYTTAGGSTERIFLFLAYLDKAQWLTTGGGVREQQEDIRLVELGFAEALRKTQNGEICDAKTVIALQRLALDRETK